LAKGKERPAYFSYHRREKKEETRRLLPLPCQAGRRSKEREKIGGGKKKEKKSHLRPSMFREGEKRRKNTLGYQHSIPLIRQGERGKKGEKGIGERKEKGFSPPHFRGGKRERIPLL